MGVKEFEGFWALILGGSSGLGLASAQKLAEAGMNIIIVHRDGRAHMPDIEAAFKRIQEIGVRCVSFNQNALDATERTSMLHEIEQHIQGSYGIKTMVHAIARGNLKRLAAANPNESTLSAQDMALTIEAMGTSFWGWADALRTKKLLAPDARIIGLTSEGNQRAWPYYAAVSAAKATLEALARSMAVEWGREGIKTNIIQSGVVITPSFLKIPTSERLREFAETRNPLGRLTLPEDVANVVYLLSKQEASWINGSIIRVDGGEAIA